MGSGESLFTVVSVAQGVCRRSFFYSLAPHGRKVTLLPAGYDLATVVIVVVVLIVLIGFVFLLLLSCWIGFGLCKWGCSYSCCRRDHWLRSLDGSNVFFACFRNGIAGSPVTPFVSSLSPCQLAWQSLGHRHSPWIDWWKTTIVNVPQLP